MYHSTKDNFTACEAECTKLKCDCFDWKGGAQPPSPALPPAPPPAPLGPSGEVWATHTDLNGARFGVVMAAELAKDYTMQVHKDPCSAVISFCNPCCSA